MRNKWEISDKAKYEHMWYDIRNKTYNEYEKIWVCSIVIRDDKYITDVKYMSKEMLCE